MVRPVPHDTRVRPVRRATLAEDVYESIKTLVIEHAIAPGERVSIDALARQLGVSPTPVREALARLESDGLVHKRPLSGYRTTALLTRAEFDELVEVRLLLECAAAERAAGHASPVDRRRIMATAAATGADRTGAEGLRQVTFAAQDARFHDLVARAAGNTLLREAISRLHAHLHLHRLSFPVTETATTAAEHRRIAVAVAAGDPVAAAAAMRRHLEATRERHLPLFPAAPATPGPPGRR